MTALLAFFIAVIFSLALLYIFAFSVGQLDLSVLYLKALKKRKHEQQPEKPDQWPMVTIQLPVFNVARCSAIARLYDRSYINAK